MIGRLLAMSLGLLLALAASQAPEFAQQYRQRLGGAIDALRVVVARFDENARAASLTREQAIARFAGQADPVIQSQAAATGEDVDRLARLERQRDDIAAAGSFSRLLVVLRQADPLLARATYLDFEPAWPATSEGVVTGGVGFLVGWAGLLLLFRTLGRLRPSRPARAASSRFRSA